MGGQTFLVFLFLKKNFLRELWGFRLFLLHAYKNCCNFLMRGLIALKFGTIKVHIEVNLGAEFCGVNLISIQSVRSVDLCRK